MPEYDDLDFKIPVEADDYPECSQFVTATIGAIIKDAIDQKHNKIIINTNLKLGLPMENILAHASAHSSTGSILPKS